MRQISVFAALAGSAIACTATAQDVTFELLQTEDISVLSSESTDFFIGSNPIDIAWDGRSLYVAGFNNTPNNQNILIAQIFDFLDGPGVRTFAAVNGSQRVSAGFNTYGGLDWDDQGGLLSSYDDFTGGTGQFQVYTLAGPSGTLTESAASIGGRGRATPSWDNGFDGMGFMRGDGTMGPAASVLDNDSTTASGWGIASVGQAGPIGLDPTDPDLGPVYAAFADPFPPFLQGPRLIPSNGDTDQTLWRGLDIEGPWVVGRAANDLVIAERGSDNLTIGEPTRVDNGNHPFFAGQGAIILDGQQCGGDIIMYNLRPDTDLFGMASCSGVLTNSLQLSDTAGNPLSYEIVDANGAPVTFETGNCIYGFDWSADDQLLFVSDFVNRLVYVLTPSCGTGGCNDADLAEPFGVLDLGDITTFSGAFVAMDPIADLADPVGIFDLADINAFVTAFLAGCP
jgi:hypothetical protein